jgi:hypothetical protein
MDDEREEPTAPGRFTLTYVDGGEEHTVDLDEVPDEKLPARVRRWVPAQHHAAVEDIRWMADHGETLTGVAERLSRLRGRRVTVKAVERFLHRHDAHSVVWQLKAAEDGEPAPDSPDWHLARRIGPARAKLSPEEAEASRRRWVKGPEDSGLPPLVFATSAPRSPFSRVARGQSVRGRKL